MNKLLFITAHSPSPKAVLAGHKIAFERLEYFAQKHSVDLIIIANGDEIDRSVFVDMKNVNIVMIKPLNKWLKLKNIFFSGKVFPLKCSTRFDTEVLHFIQENKDNYHQVHFEFTHAATYCQHVDFLNSILSMTVHDVLLQQKLRSCSFVLDPIDLPATFNYEQNVFKQMSTIYTLCEKDKDLVSSMYSIHKSKIDIIQPRLSSFTKTAASRRNKSTIEQKSILFWGAMNRPENQDAVIAFVEKYNLFLIHHQIKLYIVGNKPSSKIQSLSSVNIEVTGFIEDPTPYFLKSTIGIVPLLYGAGIKIKTLEMLACGLPVLSTEIGAEGICDENLYVTSLDKFESSLVQMLNLKD